jgi:hypothetical protein
VQTCKRPARTSVIQLWNESDAQAGKNDSASLTGLPLVKIGLRTARGGRFITSSTSDNVWQLMQFTPPNAQVRKYRFFFVG